MNNIYRYFIKKKQEINQDNILFAESIKPDLSEAFDLWLNEVYPDPIKIITEHDDIVDYIKDQNIDTASAGVRFPGFTKIKAINDQNFQINIEKMINGDLKPLNTCGFRSYME